MQSIETALGIGQVYRVRWSNRLGSLCLFVFCAGFAFFLAGSTREGGNPLSPGSCFMLGLVVLIAGFATLSSFFDRVTLYSDAVEHR
jgi:hypothetical protein